MPSTEPLSLVSAMYSFFGKHPDTQTLMEFSRETKALTPEDKAEIKTGLIANGYILRD
jgi:hypothetical protein